MFNTYVHLSSEAYLHSMRDEQKHQGKARTAQWNFWLVNRKEAKKARQPILSKQRRNEMSLRPPRQALGAK
ncbi:MAG: hypothetical protein KF893_27280 [Caldilineaceae bacterium]|nr:hypothetical protein [Caldilineaceae bacterium]